MAAGGTLLLDEIGELPVPTQQKCFQRVGGRQEIRSDARVLAATKRDLQPLAASARES
jgi:transcriptional regulator with GAF, ATPase, and Fis domain